MDAINLIHGVTWSDLPPVIQQQARRCLLDTLGAALGGRKTAVSAIIYDYAATVYGGGGGAPLVGWAACLPTGRRAGPCHDH